MVLLLLRLYRLQKRAIRKTRRTNHHAVARETLLLQRDGRGAATKSARAGIHCTCGKRTNAHRVRSVPREIAAARKIAAGDRGDLSATLCFCRRGNLKTCRPIVFRRSGRGRSRCALECGVTIAPPLIRACNRNPSILAEAHDFAGYHRKSKTREFARL